MSEYIMRIGSIITHTDELKESESIEVEGYGGEVRRQLTMHSND